MNQEDKTHWKRLINPKYIGAYSLPPGQDLTVRIKSVGREIVKGTDGKEEECTVAQLHGQKPLILNRTNQKSIERLVGSPYIEDWRDKEITLYATKTKVAKEVVECLRIRPTVNREAIPKKTLTPARFTEALQAIREGRRDEAFFAAHYDLTDDQKAKMREMAAELAAANAAAAQQGAGNA